MEEMENRSQWNGNYVTLGVDKITKCMYLK